jgi:autotransporter-associated beta strand protein
MILDRLACQSRRDLRDRGRIAGSHSLTWRGLLLMASAGVGALAMLAPKAARATDGTWQGPTAEWTTGTNWSSSPAVPDNTATFTNNGAPTSVNISASTSINTMLFAPGAPAYSFTLGSSAAFTIAGAGIVNTSSNAPNFFVGPISTLSFTNNSTAGNAVITNNANGFSAVTSFFNSSTAGNATINNTNLGFTSFNDTSTAGNATITSANGGFVSFLGTSTAGSATIIVNPGGSAFFSNNSTAGSATIADGGTLSFSNASSAGSANITNNSSLAFSDTSTAGSATITTNGSAAFNNSSTAGNATIINNGGLRFFDTSTAGDATITINSTGTIVFNTSSSAGNATITNNNFLQFANSTTAGNAIITTNAGGTTFFQDNSTAALARLITNSGGVVDISGLTAAGMTAGSIEGAGSYSLGSKSLTVGGSNLSTQVSGVIQDGGSFGGAGGSLVKVGTGILTLSGVNTYTGTTTVNAGALIVNGSIASSSLTTVNSGAALIGSGTVGSTVINSGGFLVPGNSPGTMTVAGNLALQSGAFYIVQVNPTTASTTNVSGTASLAGTVGAVFAPGSYVTRSYTILTAAGGVTGTFDAGAVRGLPAGFLPSLSYTGNTVVLNLEARLVPISPEFPVGLSTSRGPIRLTTFPSVPGLPDLPDQPGTAAQPLPPFTTNQLNVGLAIDNFFGNGGALPPAFVSLYGLTGSNLTNALDQLSGEATTGAQKVAFQLTDQFINVMLDPFVDGRSGIGGADHPALGFAPAREAMPPDIALAYAKVFKEAPAPVPVYEPRWTAWGGAYGGANRTSGDLAITGSHDLSARTAGFTSGLDYRVTPDTVVGFALAGGGTGWSLANNLGGGKSDAFQAGVYGATKYGPAYLAGAFAFTNHWMSTDRTAVGDHLTADFNAQSYGGRIEGGYRFGTPYGGITPYAAIQAQSFHTPGITETDGIANGFALAFGSRDATDTRSELGTRFDRVLAVYTNAVLALRGRLAWAHDSVTDPTLLPAFQALPGASFIVNGATPAKNSALASAGTELRLANGVTLLAKFDGEFASHSSTYAGTGTVRYVW